MKNVIYRKHQLLFVLTAILTAALSIAAQSTAFTYQGRLNSGGNPASGTFEMQFQLFDSEKGGTQVGTTITDSSVAITNGVFTTSLDFGPSFDGSPRYLEVGVRAANDPNPFTVLSPRSAIKYVPYAVRSIAAGASDALSAACVDCVTSSQVQTLDGAKITGEIPTLSVPSGSVNYIQNSVAAKHAGRPEVIQEGSFNISGDGSIGGSLVVNKSISLPGSVSPGVAPAGQVKIYFDSASNKVKVSENSGAFVNLVGATGVSGSGTANSIPLWSAGTSLGSSLISQSAGTVSLPNNVVMAAGAQGYSAAFGSPNGETGLTIAAPSGSRADLRFDGTTLKLVTRPAGSGPPSETSGISVTTGGAVGIGTAAPTGRLEIAGGTPQLVLRDTNPSPWPIGFIGNNQGNLFLSSYSGGAGVGVRDDGTVGIAGRLTGYNGGNLYIGGPSISTNVQGNSYFSGGVLRVNGDAQVTGYSYLYTFASGGDQAVCRNSSSGIISFCSSSLRYKENIESFDYGLNVVEHLRPISFDWKEGGMKDVGFGAEDVAKINPLFVTYNKDGQVEGVKYDRLSVVFVNAFKEQQAQIELQQKEIDKQNTNNRKLQVELDSLKEIVCAHHRNARACKARN